MIIIEIAISTVLAKIIFSAIYNVILVWPIELHEYLQTTKKVLIFLLFTSSTSHILVYVNFDMQL